MRWIFIKLCYFMLVGLLFACRGEASTKAVDTQEKSSPNNSTEENKNTAKTILFFGDSLTAGYGLSDTNDAFPALIQAKIDSLDLDYTVVNSGVSGETTAGGRSRLAWVLKQHIDIFVLELGANDGLRGVPLQETRENLQAIIDTVQQKSPDVTIILAGMELPPNMGPDYTTAFRTIFSDLASKNKLAFIPFILKDVGGIAELNQADGIHPTVKGHQIVANTVWNVLQHELQ